MDVDMITFILVISSLLSFCFILNKKLIGSKSLNLPPGPPKLPIIGNLHQMAGALPHHIFRDLAKKYGPIIHVQLGNLSTVVISSPQLAKEVFKTNDLALASRPYTQFADIVLYGSSDVALGPYSDYWRQMKKIVTVEMLNPKKVRSFGCFREQEVEDLIEFIRSNCGKPMRIRDKVTRMINNIVCKSSFGDNCKHQEELIELTNQLGRLVTGTSLADVYPEFGFLSVINGKKSKLTSIHKSLDDIFNVIFEERKIKRQRNEESQDDLLDVLFNIKEAGGLQFPITDDNIKALFVNTIVGGTDTTAITIEWAMTEMMRNPNVMEKAQKEVREAFTDKKKINESELQDLVYLNFIVKETLRLHPPLPLLLPRECREQCQIDGYDIPVKTQVLVSAFACAIDPEYWDDAESFKPERFEKSSVDFMGTNVEFLPFGSGRRLCPGINFGVMSIKLALAQMLYYFNWKLPSGSSPEDIDMEEEDGGATLKKVPLMVIPTHYT